jgi:AraC-like DNA-binding protein
MIFSELHHIYNDLTLLSDDDCFAVYFRSGEELNYPIHSHAEIEISLICQGQGNTLAVGERIIPIDHPFELFVMGPGVKHGWVSPKKKFSKETKVITIHFLPQILSSKLLEKDACRFVREMIVISRRGMQFSPAVSESLSGKIFSLLNRTGIYLAIDCFSIISKLSCNPEYHLMTLNHVTPISDSESQFLQNVVNFLLTQDCNNITAQAVAQHVDTTVGYLLRIVEKNLCISFKALLEEIKLQKASSILLQKQHSIKTVAKLTGFQGESALVDVFKKKRKTTPESFIKQYSCGVIIV